MKKNSTTEEINSSNQVLKNENTQSVSSPKYRIKNTKMDRIIKIYTSGQES